MQTVKHWVLIFNEPWPLWPVATPATPSTALSGLPFCVCLWVFGQRLQSSAPSPALWAVAVLRGGVRGVVLTSGDRLTFLGDGNWCWCWRGPLPMAMLA